MGMNIGSGSGGGEPDVMVDINTTPLIDVMLVLLIMLIITIPPQLHSVNMDMPVGVTAPKKKDPTVIKIEVTANSVVNWNGKPLESKAALEAKLKEASLMSPQPEIHVRSNAKAKYEVVAGVLAGAQRLGLNKLGIVGSEQFAN